MRAFTFIVLAGLLSTANGQGTWPSKPIRIITGASAGSAVDLRARLYAQKLAQFLGQPVLVENRPGGSEAIAAEAVAVAPADGYTLLATSSSAIIFNPLVNPGLRYQPLRDFAPISILIAGYLLLGANSDLGINSLAELVRLAKSRPIYCGTSGQATATSFACSLLAQAAEIDLANVSYKGSAQAALGLATGEIQVAMTVTFDQMPHIRTGRIRPLAVLGPRRLPSTPEVPTIGEAGYPGLDMYVWALAAAPASTPTAVLQRLNAEFARAASEPDVQRSITVTGGFYPSLSLEQVAEFVNEEHARWSKVIAHAGVKPN